MYTYHSLLLSTFQPLLSYNRLARRDSQEEWIGNLHGSCCWWSEELARQMESSPSLAWQYQRTSSCNTLRTLYDNVQLNGWCKQVGVWHKGCRVNIQCNITIYHQWTTKGGQWVGEHYQHHHQVASRRQISMRWRRSPPNPWTSCSNVSWQFINFRTHLISYCIVWSSVYISCIVLLESWSNSTWRGISHTPCMYYSSTT